MAKTVFILGAGASRQAGGPLMTDFLDKARDLLDLGQAAYAEESLRLVFKGRTKLKAVHSMAGLDIDNLEAVFAAFEMAKILGGLKGLKPEENDRLDYAIRELILRTLEMTVLYTPDQRDVRPPSPYHDFVLLLGQIQEQRCNSASVLTFNYDLGLDYAFHFCEIPFTYALPSLSKCDKAISLLKLHGSLNWGHCSKCGMISFWNLRKIASESCWDLISHNRARINFTKAVRRCANCDKDLEKEPKIIPPTWNKAQHYAEIETVWQKAAYELSEADNIFIIGYSWPTNDHFFHYLYGLGTIADETTHLRRLWVFNPDANLYHRFKEILGPTAMRRFDFFAVDFAGAINCIRHILIQASSRIPPEIEKHRVSSHRD